MTESQNPEVVVGIGSSALASVVGPGSPIASGSADLVLLQQLRQRLAQVNVQLATSGTKYGAKSPVMIQLNTERASIDAQTRAELERIRVRTKNELDLAILAEDGIRRQIAAQERIVDKVTEKADRLVLLQEEAQSNRGIYQDLYSKLEEASVTAGIKASNITLVDPARIPAQPSYPKKKATIAFGALIGLVVGFAAAFLWDYFDDSIAMPEQVEQITAIPVIGAIPDFNQRKSATGSYGFARGFTLKKQGSRGGKIECVAAPSTSISNRGVVPRASHRFVADPSGTASPCRSVHERIAWRREVDHLPQYGCCFLHFRAIVFSISTQTCGARRLTDSLTAPTTLA
jgi:hypothetical protein